MTYYTVFFPAWQEGEAPLPGRRYKKPAPQRMRGGSEWNCAYLAYSVARLSRITLTLIWPG